MNSKHIMQLMRSRRLCDGVSATLLSEISGYHRNSIYLYERGERAIPLHAACDIAQALGLELVLRDRATGEEVR